MANNCLQTKLKASVENDNLVKIGELRLNITNVEAFAAHPEKLEIIGTDLTTVISSDYKSVSIKSKYNITNIIGYQINDLFKVDFNDLKYCTSLKSINVVGVTKWSGSIIDLPQTIKELRLGNIPCDISEFGHLTSLTQLQMSGTTWDVSGDLEDFVTAQINNPVSPRTSCNNLILGQKYNTTAQLSGNVKFQGVKLTGNAKLVTWNWDGTSPNITVSDYQ